MYLVLIFLPLLGALSSGMFGRLLGVKGSCFITILCLFLSFFFSAIGFYEVGLSSCPVYIKLATWIDSELLNVDWGFLFDSLSITMCCLVTFISLIVHIYSVEYMSNDPHLSRFMAYLSLFTFFMLILISADNFIQMFVGWEGVGLCSFLLINFWYTKIQANKAAIKAIIINRIGDYGLILGILTIFVKFKAVDYSTVFLLTPLFAKEKFIFLNIEVNLLNIICILLFIGAIGKSAQLGLHTWLPDAMEGPTPVSALIHAATMVTAGIFLVARCSPIFEYVPFVLKIITIVGSCTAFFAATIALFQNDLKKVIAYSTCSQLGYMFIACGLSSYSTGVFHLINHAFFKALLFLSAGSIIHAISDEQDMRKMGGLKNLIPFTYSVMIIGSLSLTGIPFLTGFYSKEIILELAYGSFSIHGHFSYLLGSFGTFLTAFYSTRLIYLTFLSIPSGYKSIICSAHDSSFKLCFTLAILTIPSIFIGYYTRDMFIGIGTDFWGTSIFINPNNVVIIDAEFIETFFKLLPVIVCFLGIFLSYILNNSSILFNIKMSFVGKKIYLFFNKKWFFDKIFNEYLNQRLFSFSYSISYKILDKGIFELFGPTGISIIVTKLAHSVKSLQTGFLYHYTFLMLIGSTLLLGVRQFCLLFGSFIDYKSIVIIFVASIMLYSIEKTDFV